VESVELATILLTDLVGSTRLANSVGPVRADELRDESFELLREAIASSGGQEAKNTGDGLMVAFASTSAAVGCAVAMQQLFERRNRRVEPNLHVRIGLAAGEATVKDGDYFGMPSIEAARLCELAPADGILISGIAKALAGRCEGIEFNSAGELELKGFPDPVEAFEIRWLDSSASVIELPERIRALPVGEFVGRAEERTRLAELWLEADAGSRRLVLLGGEAGVGKTSLSAQLAVHAHEHGATVLYGRCEEDLGVPYLPWTQALDHYVEHATELVLRRYAGRHGGDLARLVPNLARRLPGLEEPRQGDPETERYALYAAVHGLLEVAAEQEPLLLILDDLHWADGPTLSLLRHVAGADRSRAMMVMGTYRDTDLAREGTLTRLLADLHREQGVKRLTLEGLRADDVTALIESAVGHELDEEGRALALKITHETDGNPFFAGELLRHLDESGAITRDDRGRWRLTGEIATLGLPQSVREVIGRRVARLGSDGGTVLSAASVIGREFEIDLLLAVVELPEAQVLDLLEQAESASLLKEHSERAGRFAFAHALIEYTLYEELGGVRRARLHRRVAEALEAQWGETGERLGELAFHWAEAGSTVENEKAIRYAELAARLALEQLAPAEAVRLYGQALALLDQSPGEDRARHCELLVGLGEAQQQAGDPEFRQTLLDGARAARELGQADLLYRAVLANSRGWSSQVGAVDLARVEALEAAAEILPGSDVRRARVLALLAAELHYAGKPDRCRALAVEAVEVARASGDLPVLAGALINAIHAIWVPDTFAQRVRWAQELASLLPRIDEPSLRFWASQRCLVIGLEAGDRAGAQEALGTMRELSAPMPGSLIAFNRVLHESGWALVRGELDSAEAYATEASRIGARSGQRDAAAAFQAIQFNIRYFQGRLGELVDRAVDVAGKAPATTIWRPSAALALIADGRPEEASELAMGIDFTAIPWDGLWPAVVFTWADVCWRLKAAERAGELLDLLLPFSEQFMAAGSTVWGSASWALGALATTVADYDQAEHHLAAAAEQEERFGSPLFLARTHAAWGRALLARGAPDDLERAYALLERARKAARELAAEGILQEAAPAPRAMGSSVDG
jgi:class 3 adenylate cyclase